MTTIQFENVGRSKISWRADIKTFSPVAVIREIKKRRVLMSNDIDLSLDDPPFQRHGTIFAGMRPVGTFRAVDEDEIPMKEQDDG